MFKVAYFFFINFVVVVVYSCLKDRQSQSTSRGGAERERGTQNLKHAPGSELSAQSPTRRLEPTNPKIMT